MSHELSNDDVVTSALGPNARLFGASSSDAVEPTSYGREAVLNYISASLNPVASSGSASDLTSGTLPLGRLHAHLQQISSIASPAVGDLLHYAGSGDGGWKSLQAGPAGFTLQSQGEGAVPAWVSPAALTDDVLWPMEGQYVVLDETTTLSRWIGGLLWHASTDALILVEQLGTGHVQEHSMLVIRKSQDGGDTWRNLKTIFSRESDPFIRASAFASFSTTRIAGIVNTGDLTRKTWAIVTDDAFATATVTDITSSMTLGSHFVYGLMLPWPAIAGGHDTTGWQVLSYGGASTDIKVIRTDDNGATWSDAVVKTSTGLPSAAQEPSLVRLSDGRWFIATRTTSNGNVWGTVAPADMSSWSDWFDLGIPLGSNEVHILVDGEYVYLHAFYRESFAAPSGDSSLADDNAVVAWRARSASIVAGSQPFSDRRIMARLIDRAIGYPQSVQDPYGNWYHIQKIGEGDSTNEGSGSSLCLVRQVPGAVRGVGSVLTSRQVIEDPTFSQWPRGDTITASSTTGQWIGRWYLNPSNATVTATRTELPENVRACMPYWTTHGIVVDNTGSANDFVGIHHRWLGDDAARAAYELGNRQRATIRMWGWDEFPSLLRAPFIVNGVDAVRNATTANFSAPIGVEGAAPWVTELVYRTENLEDVTASGTLTDPFTTVNGDATVTVAHPAHKLHVGNPIAFEGADAVGGLDMNASFTVATVIDANSYTFEHTSAATGSVSGGGGSTDYEYHLNFPPAEITSCLVSIDNSSVSAEMTLKLASVEMFLGGAPPLEMPRSPQAEVLAEAATRRYCQRYATSGSAMVCAGHARTSGIFWGAFTFEPMCISSPVVSTSAASDFQARAGGGDYAGTALAAANITRSRCRLALTISGTMTTGHGGEMEVVSSPGSGAPYIDIVAAT